MVVGVRPWNVMPLAGHPLATTWNLEKTHPSALCRTCSLQSVADSSSVYNTFLSLGRARVRAKSIAEAGDSPCWCGAEGQVSTGHSSAGLPQHNPSSIKTKCSLARFPAWRCDTGLLMFTVHNCTICCCSTMIPSHQNPFAAVSREHASVVRPAPESLADNSPIL